MKKMILGILLSVGLTSCVVSDPYEPNPLNNSNISEYCYRVFEQDVKANVECFYKIYYVARFLQASAEEQVSAKYDNIRTGLRGDGNSYSFDSMNIAFTKDDPFTVGGIWKVKKNYSRGITITMTSENEWKIDAETDEVTILLTLLSADDAGMKLNMELKGKWTEESSYSARFRSESVGAEMINKTPIALGESFYSGVISYDFYDKQSKIMDCDMTLRPGSTPIYSIHM